MNDATYGNYYNTQGSCVTSGSTTTCDLTGSFTSSTPGYAAGTYDFQTVFTGSIASSVHLTDAVSGGDEPAERLPVFGVCAEHDDDAEAQCHGRRSLHDTARREW